MPGKKAREKSNSKSVKKKIPKWYYIVLVLLPIILLFLLEAGLRIFNYGKEFRT
jgi:hypothetical protein